VVLLQLILMHIQRSVTSCSARLAETAAMHLLLKWSLYVALIHPEQLLVPALSSTLFVAVMFFQTMIMLAFSYM
jgi:hypothetical protein